MVKVIGTGRNKNDTRNNKHDKKLQHHKLASLTNNPIIEKTDDFDELNSHLDHSSLLSKQSI